MFKCLTVGSEAKHNNVKILSYCENYFSRHKHSGKFVDDDLELIILMFQAFLMSTHLKIFIESDKISPLLKNELFFVQSWSANISNIKTKKKKRTKKVFEHASKQ